MCAKCIQECSVLSAHSKQSKNRVWNGERFPPLTYTMLLTSQKWHKDIIMLANVSIPELANAVLTAAAHFNHPLTLQRVFGLCVIKFLLLLFLPSVCSLLLKMWQKTKKKQRLKKCCHFRKSAKQQRVIQYNNTHVGINAPHNKCNALKWTAFRYTNGSSYYILQNRQQQIISIIWGQLVLGFVFNKAIYFVNAKTKTKSNKSQGSNIKIWLQQAFQAQ